MTKLWIVLLCAAAVSRADVVEQTSEQSNLSFAPGALKKLTIDNVFGGIHVTGYNGSNVEVHVTEDWRADDSSRMQQARREVKLETTTQSDSVTLYVDGPFRRDNRNRHWDGDPGYSVNYEFEIRVPINAALELRTVNHGTIHVENSNGDFLLRNVNGAIELTDSAGSGTVKTVNGGIKVSFRQNPKAPCSFKTVNGEVVAYFQPNLAADFHVQTLNGEVFTDYELTALPGVLPAGEHIGGRLVYRTNRQARLRSGSGGPEHQFDTLNGTIRILKRG
jgi:hypothetical protein